MNTRQQDIVDILSQRGEVTVKELSEIFAVTEMTIHRDLDFLQQEKYLYKKRGAAVFVEKDDRKAGFYDDEKRAIGKAAASLILSGQSIIFDNSTTALFCARHLNGIKGLTFYTTSLEAAAILSKYPDTVLYCSGGYYFHDSKGFVGTQAESFAESVEADICIIGASGISIEKGITNPYPMHSALQRKILESAKKRILLADHSKFGKVAIEKAAELSEIDIIVTDSHINNDILSEYRKHTEIIIA